MRPNWAKGYNFNPDDLNIYTYESGFILGQSKLGDKLGVDGAETQIDATFNSINVSYRTSVESGLYVHREVAEMTLSATLPSYIDLMKQRVSVRYGSQEIFKGTVQEFNCTETVDDRYWLPGNTATKAYEVDLTVTAGDEDFSEAITPPKDFVSTQLQTRVADWLGMDLIASWSDPDPDLGKDTYDNIELIGSTDRVVNASDDMPDLASTLRDHLKIMNMHYVYKPWESTVYVRNNNRWHYSSTNTEADSLIFSDDPNDDVGVVLPFDGYLHNDRHVMYSTREWGYEPSYFQGSVKIQTNFGGEEVFGPYRANEVNPSDPVVDLGVQWIDGGDKLPRNYVSTLPLKRSSEAFTKSITVPLQSTLQLAALDQVPGMALLKHDGVTERVAVLGVSMNITPHLWTVTYTFGPHHLLDRQGDFDPSIPRGIAFVDDGAVTGTVRFRYMTPEVRPTDVSLWAYVYTGGSPNANNISWSSDIVVRQKASIDGFGAEQIMPTSVTYYSTARPTTPGVYFYYLAITSDPEPGSGVVNQQYRQSQPVLIGTVVVT